MTMPELFLIAIGLSMDAFSVSICKGLSLQKAKLKHCLTCGIYFGFFQALMPLLGWTLGGQFQTSISKIDHWIAFFLLTLLGLAMIRDSDEHAQYDSHPLFTPRAMLPLSIATSIDALTVGITFAFLRADILSAVLFIGITTFLLSGIGVWFGSKFGNCLQEKSCFLGGLILIFMGFKILLTHLHPLSF